MGARASSVGRDLDENDIAALSPGIFDSLTKLEFLYVPLEKK